MLTDHALEELRTERHADYVAEAHADATPKNAPPPGYALRRCTLPIGTAQNDADRHHPCTLNYTVNASKFDDDEQPAQVILYGYGPGLESQNRFTPETARRIADALISAADICDAFEARQTLLEEDALARFNAGPLHNNKPAEVAA